MMQHVATSKSEVAAFATTAESHSLVDSGTNAQFGQLFQDQKVTNPVIVKPKVPSSQAPSNNGRPSTDEVKSDATSLVKEHSTDNKRSESVNAKSLPNSSSSQDKTATEAIEKTVIEDQGDNRNYSEVPEGADATSESQLLSVADQKAKKSSDESSEIVAEEWVLLIDNLKRLAGNDESLTSTLEQLNETAADLTLIKQAESELSEQMADNTFADNSRMSLDGFVAALVTDSKDPNGPVVPTKKRVEQTSSMNAAEVTGATNVDVLVTKTQSEQYFTDLVDKALSEVLANADAEQLPPEKIIQKTAELLLEQPDVMQKLINQLQGASQQSDSAEHNAPDVTLDSAIKNDSILANQLPESVSQADLTHSENKNLLSTLVVETETNTNNTIAPDKLPKVEGTKTAATVAQIQDAEVGIKTVESSVDPSVELVEQEVRINQEVTSNQTKLNKTEIALDNKDIKSLLNLSDSKLDKVLENIAQRVFENKNTAESISPEQVVQQVVTPKTAEIISAMESSSKDFVSALKSGLEEFKNQLSQGREPGIDLKALIAEALSKTTDSATATVAKAPVNLEQIASSVSQVLDLAQSMSRTIEERHDQVYSATLREVAQVQGEQVKQSQLNQLESKFEKAVNITKPEGHQQLAEKVRWMVNTKNLVAEIRLDPAELGSVHVKVAVSGESATVNFVVQSQQARDAVDTATPRLREMLAEKGIELGQSSVRQESDGQQSQGEGEFTRQGGSGNNELENLEVSEQVLAQQNIVNGALGGIDYFV